jgi:hypothetical protein
MRQVYEYAFLIVPILDFRFWILDFGFWILDYFSVQVPLLVGGTDLTSTL